MLADKSIPKHLFLVLELEDKGKVFKLRKHVTYASWKYFTQIFSQEHHSISMPCQLFKTYNTIFKDMSVTVPLQMYLETTGK